MTTQNEIFVALHNSALLTALLAELNEALGNSHDSRLNQQTAAKMITERYTDLVAVVIPSEVGNKITEKAGDLEKVTQWSSGDAALFNSGLFSALLGEIEKRSKSSGPIELSFLQEIFYRYVKQMQTIFVTDYKG